MKILMILEVSQKQGFIFASRKLKDNRSRSALIAYLTGGEFFKAVCPELYSDENMVYAGGGHTVLQFESAENAGVFARKVSGYVLKTYPALEYYLTQLPYDEKKTAGENLNLLSQKLEKKKALRRQSFYMKSTGLGFESAFVPDIDIPESDAEKLAKAEGFSLSVNPEEWGDDGFIAVIHIDGNAMGKRVQKIYEDWGEDWELCREALQGFSADIDEAFEAAFTGMTSDLISYIKKTELDGEVTQKPLPLRRIIRAGDDVCFVTAGRFGLACAASYLQHLEKKTIDGENLTACAGIAMVHTKYPFRQAYDLSEQLCSNAKKYLAEEELSDSACAMDWHIDFGQLKPALTDIRMDYIAEDSTLMTVRPVLVKEKSSGYRASDKRTYTFIKNKTAAFAGGKLPRTKLKGMREKLAQGEKETEFYVTSNLIADVKDNGLFTDGLYFNDKSGNRRSTCWDAIELMDHVVFFEEET